MKTIWSAKAAKQRSDPEVFIKRKATPGRASPGELKTIRSAKAAKQRSDPEVFIKEEKQ